MAYTATSWVNGSEPAINAANLNKLEAGVVAAHEAAAVPTAWEDVSGKPSTFPAKAPAWADVTGKPAVIAAGEDAAAARAAIGAGTSSVTVGTGASNAKAGNWVPKISDVTGLQAKISELESRIAALEPGGE